MFNKQPITVQATIRIKSQENLSLQSKPQTLWENIKKTMKNIWKWTFSWLKKEE